MVTRPAANATTGAGSQDSIRNDTNNAPTVTVSPSRPASQKPTAGQMPTTSPSPPPTQSPQPPPPPSPLQPSPQQHHTFQLPNGVVVDSKNTLQSHSLLAVRESQTPAGTPDAAAATTDRSPSSSMDRAGKRSATHAPLATMTLATGEWSWTSQDVATTVVSSESSSMSARKDESFASDTKGRDGTIAHMPFTPTTGHATGFYKQSYGVENVGAILQRDAKNVALGLVQPEQQPPRLIDVANRRQSMDKKQPPESAVQQQQQQQQDAATNSTTMSSLTASLANATETVSISLLSLAVPSLQAAEAMVEAHVLYEPDGQQVHAFQLPMQEAYGTVAEVETDATTPVSSEATGAPTAATGAAADSALDTKRASKALKWWTQGQMWKWASATVVVLLALVVTTTLVATRGSRGDRSNSSATDGNGVSAPNSNSTSAVSDPTVSSTPVATATTTTTDRAQQIVDFINSISLTNRSISLQGLLQGNALTVEEMAARWIIYDDPLQLTPPVRTATTQRDGGPNQFWLQQRYAVATLWAYLLDNAALVSAMVGHECEWLGQVNVCRTINVSAAIGLQQVVTEFRMANALASGQISPDLALLSHLEHVELSGNVLTGSIPSSIGTKWTALKYFAVSGNDLSGSLPTSIGQWTNLESFQASGCELTGSLPDAIGNWTSLAHFDVCQNALTGKPPSSIEQWTNLEHFAVEYNGWTGELPSSLGEWTNLEYFNIDSSGLMGSLPPSIVNWTNLKHFSLGANNMTGLLPEGIGQWLECEFFFVGANALSGNIPESIGQWAGLKHFVIDKNGLTGPLPNSIGEWTSLEVFQIVSNDVTGTLPPSIGQWSNLTRFTLYLTYANGTLPASIGNWTNLVALSLAGNDVAGTLPDSIGQWSQLETAMIFNNLLTGSLPDSIAEWTNLMYFSMDSSFMTGSLPASIETAWTDIREITFAGENFVGSIPDGLCSASNATAFIVDCDQINCTCSSDVCKC